MRIMREFGASAFKVGEAVEDVTAIEIGPPGHDSGRETAIARWRGEEEDFLPRRQDPRADDLWKQLGQPWPRGEYEPVGADALARREADCRQALLLIARRLNESLHVGPACLHEPVDECLHRAPGHQ